MHGSHPTLIWTILRIVHLHLERHHEHQTEEYIRRRQVRWWAHKTRRAARTTTHASVAAASHTPGVREHSRLHGQSRRHHARVGRRSLAHPWCLRGGPLASGPYARGGGTHTPAARPGYDLSRYGAHAPGALMRVHTHTLRTLTPLRARTARRLMLTHSAGTAPTAFV